MSATTVVSCPECLRQYEISANIECIVAQCGVCKATFKLFVPKLVEESDGVLVLEKVIEPHINYLKEACEALGGNACTALRLSGRVVTPRSVLQFVEQATSDRVVDYWRNHYGEGNETPLDGDEWSKCVAYFTQYYPDRSRYARDMLRSAFLGVLGGIDWPESCERIEAASLTKPAAPRRRKRGLIGWWRGRHVGASLSWLYSGGRKR